MYELGHAIWSEAAFAVYRRKCSAKNGASRGQFAARTRAAHSWHIALYVARVTQGFEP